MQEILDRIAKVENGFKPIELEAVKIFNTNSINISKEIALELLADELYQVRSLSVFLLGFIASKDLSVLQILKDQACVDKSWQVQEILAKAFDQFCKNNGYQNSLPIIENWLNDTNPNVCRAVIEGLRIWTARPYFNAKPETAIRLISQHKSSNSEYLRKSVGNSLRDISKNNTDLIDKELSTWDLYEKKQFFTYQLVKKNRKQ